MITKEFELKIKEYFLEKKYIDKIDTKDVSFKEFGKLQFSHSFVCKIQSRNKLFFIKFIKDEFRKSINLYESPESLSTNIVNIPNEYDNLRYLEKRGLVSCGMVPQPYLFLENENCIVMEYIHGKRLIEHLSPLRSPINFFSNKMSKCFSSTADYLVDFEKKVYDGSSKNIIPFIERITEKELNLISGFSKDQKKRVREVTWDIGSSFNRIPVHFTSTDFKPHNIICSEPLVGIDWGQVKYNGFANWMPASFVRTVGISNRFSFFEKSLKNSFIDNYMDKSIFGHEFFHLVQLFDTIIAYAGVGENSSYSAYYKNRIEKLIGK